MSPPFSFLLFSRAIFYVAYCNCRGTLFITVQWAFFHFLYINTYTKMEMLHMKRKKIFFQRFEK